MCYRAFCPLIVVSLTLYLKLLLENRSCLTFCGEYPSSGASSAICEYPNEYKYRQDKLICSLFVADLEVSD